MIMKIPSLLIDVAGPIAGVKIARRSPIVSLGIPKREDINRVWQAGAGGWSWSGVREKHCYLAGGWRLELEWCERELL